MLIFVGFDKKKPCDASLTFYDKIVCMQNIVHV